MFAKYCAVVVVVCLFVVNGDIGEPKCFSKFDYDEKMLMKQLRLEDKIQKFEDFINELKVREEKEKNERGKLFDDELEKYKEQNAEEIEKQRNVTLNMLQNITDSQIKFADILKKKAEPKKEEVVAFTVTTPAKGPGTNHMTFTTIVTNEGYGFDTSTGKFTCSIPGLYYFSLHIIKTRSSSIDSAGCHINLNGGGKVKAYIDPQDGTYGADSGSYGVSNSVYLKLAVGDVITVENCSGGVPDAVESWTSFSGYLEKRTSA